ncbi:DNA polymerase III subunit gamma/tau [Anaerovorax odorimutans]|uniref:DNA-directed DNA polymerase n=1 Tax=Anaerovorax odorimutans TaxID=109327 RepID=A0ABT1RJX6_9FIRM|nr:DNA polymerase III subunit gamma/tau [Anaerovorax odorimutans]MCQ4635492.1 DNA polymerase III subunit gamma/tau [Anaerovorax odorimutans]
MYTALYRAYRPEVFEEILGQGHIIKILKNQLASDSVSHAYLFCGTRGTGKTTTARILAKGVNCTADGERPCGVCANCTAIKEGTFMDVIEIDAASNNGVENIRELRESVKYPPAVGRKKVYIVDEVHMLSTGAFNALLKTLEEPPENVMFILATTEPQKLPATILSRCMRLDFKRVPEETLVRGMDDICAQKGIEVSQGALRLIAANADGSVRDGLSILDQCISGGQTRVEREDILDFLGTAGEEIFLELTDKITLRQPQEALLLLEQILADGKDVRQFMKDWLSHYRNLLITKFIKNPEDMLNLSPENVDRIRRQSDSLDLADINNAIIELSRTMSEAKWSTQPRILLELCMVKMATDLIDPGSAAPRAGSGTVPRAASRAASGAATGVGSGAASVSKRNSAQAQKETSAEAGNPAEPSQNQSEAEEEPAPEKSYDYDSLWHAIFEEAEASRGSFNLIRSGTRLTEMTDEIFTVVASNAAVGGYVENNRQVLEDLMEKHTGRRRGLRCELEGEDCAPKASDAERLAKIAESKLGLNIEIE